METDCPQSPISRSVATIWSGDQLVDWVGGGRTVYSLDGGYDERRVNYAYRFNAACALGEYAIIYERLGTAALYWAQRRGPA